MKRQTVVVVALALAAGLDLGSGARLPVVEAQGGPARPVPVAGRAVGFALSPPVRDLPPHEGFKPEDVDPEIVKTGALNKVIRFFVEGPAESGDPVVQTSAPSAASLAAPSVSFEGIRSGDNVPFLGGRVLPPDTDGDVGPNHYVQMVNTAWRVWDKTGTPLTPVMSLGSIWNALGAANPCADRNDGDPIVLYDALADRWLLSQFCTVADPFNHQLIAISQTSDPTGAYYVYDFVMPNNKFNDYPKFGVWPDGYYMTDNQFNQAATAFLGGGFFAFDRIRMLAGDPLAGYIYFDSCPTSTNCIVGGVLPSDLDGVVPPPPGTPNYFMMFTADEFGDPEGDGLRLWEFRADFANPAASSLTEIAPVAVAAFDPRNPTGRNDIEQPAPATAGMSLDSIQDRLMFRLAYRNFGTHESLVVNHTVNVSGVAPTTQANHQAGVRYYELRRALPGGSFAVHDQATFAPDTDNRWMASVAQDHAGNVAVGYSVSSLTTFPGIRYAGRLATGAPGLNLGEQVLLDGTGVQRSTSGRWGDYSAMAVDPVDDCTFWYTQQYYTAEGQAISTAEWQTRIFAFKYDACEPIEQGALAGTVRDAATLAPLAGAVVQTSAGHVTVTDAAGAYSLAVVAGTYAVTASAAGYGPQTASGVVVAAGATTTQDFLLAGVPVLSNAGTMLVAETCGPSTGAIDPGETVSVDFAIANSGGAATSALVATLLPGGGVTAPGSAQVYGVVAPGTTVSRTFTFTADSALNCGDPITATLALEDGASSLGMLTYHLTTGALGPVASTTYSSGSLAQPIPDQGTLDIPIAVTDIGAVDSLQVGVRLDHTFTGDLVISLVHPDGTTVVLSNRRGGSGDNFGTGANDCAGAPTVFDDAAALAIASGSAPFSGSFRPDQPLAALQGKPTSGTWILRISDQAALDVGTAGCVTLVVNRRQVLCCPFVGGTPAVAPAPPAVVTGESCALANGAPDPDETVTVEFPLRNVGSAPATNLVATLLPGGGVNGPSGPQSYGALSPLGGPESRSFTFVPSGTCGSTLTATLSVEDVGGAGPLGTVEFTLRLGGSTEVTQTFTNSTRLAIPAGAPSTTSGPAAPYPSSIDVSGVVGTVVGVSVTLHDVNHTFPADVDVLLVGPGGQRFIVLSDVGGGTDLVNVTLTLDDGAAMAVPGVITSGTYRPTNSGTGDAFAAPAPPAPYQSPAPAGGATFASVFGGLDPNGTWSLFVVDDAGGDAGNLAGGWSLALTTSEPACCTQACALECPAPISVGTDPNQCSAVVTFPNPTVVGSCGVVSCAPPSGSTFPLGTTTTACTSYSTLGPITGACSFPVTVTDTEPPAITNATATPPVLWPVNGRMVDVAIGYDVSENCAGSCVLSVTSNEPQNLRGSGNRAPDWEVVNDRLVRLRAERSGTGTGRLYRITIACTDAAGNVGTQTAIVSVPHDRRR